MPKGKHCRDVLPRRLLEPACIRIPISPFPKWVLTIHLLRASKKGMSAHQIHRMLGVLYKRVWFMMHRLRYAMTQEPLDEARRHRRGRRNLSRVAARRPARKARFLDNKTAVVAVVERGGRVRAMVMPRVYGNTIREHIVNNVEQDVRLMTGESPSTRARATRTPSLAGRCQATGPRISARSNWDEHLAPTLAGQTLADLPKVKPPTKVVTRRTKKRPSEESGRHETSDVSLTIEL